LSLTQPFVFHSKFALIVTETGDNVTAYGFQFKKKAQATPFLLALENATRIVPEDGARADGKRGNKTLIMAQRSSDILVLHAASRNVYTDSLFETRKRFILPH
jgi:hypothetical protein